MADYTNNKDSLGAVYPIGQKEAPQSRLEPLVTPEEIRMFHLFGLELTSAIVNSLTKKKAVITDAMLQKCIERALSQAELDTGLTILPVQYVESQPFDKKEMDSFGYMRLRQRPIASIQSMNIAPVNNENIFSIPLDWISMDLAQTGQVNFIPLAFGLTDAGAIPAGTITGSALFINCFGSQPWIPTFWKVTYTAGFPDGKVPVVVNELIGTIAAMEVLSMLGVTYGRQTSGSLSVDGVSQSSSGPGNQIYAIRLKELADKRQRLINKLKAQYGLNFIASNI